MESKFQGRRQQDQFRRVLRDGKRYPAASKVDHVQRGRQVRSVTDGQVFVFTTLVKKINFNGDINQIIVIRISDG